MLEGDNSNLHTKGRKVQIVDEFCLLTEAKPRSTIKLVYKFAALSPRSVLRFSHVECESSKNNKQITGHLINLGAATEDDFLIFSQHTAEAPPYVVITEKVDGANMGFSLSADRELLVQNRSHYITSTAHAQFRPLSNWIETHREGLYSVLDRDNSFPERYILYGEWVVAQHSIPYTRLPDRFLAFDLYDRKTKTWADRDTLERLHAGLNLTLVHVMYRGPRPSDNQLKEMVRSESQFYDGPVEGIYVKEERNGQVVSRGKIVRSDFVAGITEHWSKAPIKKNGIVLDNEGIL